MDFKVSYDNKFIRRTFIDFCKLCYKVAIEVDLKRCGSCRIVFYCSAEHQNEDWENHKDFCNAIYAVKLDIQKRRSTPENKYEIPGIFYSFIGGTVEEWWLFRTHLMGQLALTLNRSLTYEELLYFYYPSNCTVCFKVVEQMLYCQSCRITIYCSEAHKEQDQENHTLVCGPIRNVVELDLISRINCTATGKAESGKKLNKSIEEFVEKRLRVKSSQRGYEHLCKILLSEGFSAVLTIIYTIDRCGILKSGQKKDLTIHFLNSSCYENDMSYVWEYLCHHFKKLESLRLVFIGQDCKVNFKEPDAYCDSCKNKNIESLFHEIDYQQFIKNNTDNPDLIMGFHPTFGKLTEYLANKWKKAFKKMICYRNTIIAFTSDSKTNADKDINVFKKFCSNDRYTAIAESEENPYRSLLPVRDHVGKIDVLMYSNNFINILKTNRP